MKVLLSAYACYPGYGSEPEVGLRVLEAAASEHQVWMMTLPRNVEPVVEFLAGKGLRTRVTLIPFDPSRMTVEAAHLRGKPYVYWHYERWQQKARSVAVELDNEVAFDVAHHVTLANYWAGIGVLAIRKPLLVGPVGGGVRIPAALLPLLGARGVAAEVIRLVTQSILGSRFSRLANRQNTRILYQNQATEARTQIPGSILPNATVVNPSIGSIKGPRTSDVVVVGELEPRKGAALALRAFAHVEHPTAQLIFLGDGSRRDAIQTLAHRLGIGDRVQFLGRVDREVVLARVATAGLMLHASLRDDASLAIAEALSLGTPVVAMDYCAADLARLWSTPSRLIHPSTVTATALEMAYHIDSLLDSDKVQLDSHLVTPSITLGAGVLKAYEELGRGAGN
jgi:glycosyltransferase involved in cell wall biosynthesis